MSFVKIMLDRVQAQEPKAPLLKNAPVFYRNLEERLDERRKDNRLLMMNVPRDTVDFSSNDFLSLASSGILKRVFFEELARNPNFQIGQSGSRMMDGNTVYIENLEKEMAEFFCAESALIFNSGYEANSAIFSVLPLPGDVIAYDELVHASIIDGMEISRATAKVPFLHNDLKSFRQIVTNLRDQYPAIRNGTRNVIIAIESVYSMDGNLSPVKEMMQLAQEILPTGNFQVFFDEAHSTGLMGPLGRGMAVELGIQNQLGCRLHTFGKAMGCNGAIVLGSHTVRNMLVNFSRGFIYTAGPAFPFVATMRSAMLCLKDGLAEPQREKLQQNIRYFYKTIFAHPFWEPVSKAGIISMPESEGWENNNLLIQIVPLWTHARDNHHLAAHLHLADYKAFPVDYPVVPRGQGRIRLVFHAGNTKKELDTLIEIICTWAKEVYDFKVEKKPFQCLWAKLVATQEARKAKLVAQENEKASSRSLRIAEQKKELAGLIEHAQAYTEKSML